MRRFYFNLEGDANFTDPGGLLFYSELEAFSVARKLAKELADSRPSLRRNTTVVVTDGKISERYSIGASNEKTDNTNTPFCRAS
jgi:hypothetical protein